MHLIITSRKPRREGEVFIKNDERFVLKIYREAVEADPMLARELQLWLEHRERAMKAAAPERT